MLSFSAATSPRASTAIDRVRSPLVTAVATSAMARTWFVKFAASWLTLSVKIAPDAGCAFGDAGLPAEFPFDTDFARHRRDLIGERGLPARIDHAVDGVGKFGDFAFRFEDRVSS